MITKNIIKTSRYWLLCFLALWLPSCNTNEANLDLLPQGREYFPLEIGHYVSYNIKETNYFLNEPRKTESSYQLKEVVKEQYKDLANNTTYRIERYRRANGRDNWVLWNVWTARIDYQAGIKVEENIPIIKLIFPLESGRRWNANTLNTSEPEEFEMRDFDKKFTFSGKLYEKTLTVVQKNDSSLVSKDKRIEVYAPNVGVIYKRNDVVQYCQFDNCRGKAEIERGQEMEMTIFDYGKE
jgi:hypothetical protein